MSVMGIGPEKRVVVQVRFWWGIVDSRVCADGYSGFRVEVWIVVQGRVREEECDFREGRGISQVVRLRIGRFQVLCLVSSSRP